MARFENRFDLGQTGGEHLENVRGTFRPDRYHSKNFRIELIFISRVIHAPFFDHNQLNGFVALCRSRILHRVPHLKIL